MSFSENAEKWRGWNIQIFATDVSASALAQARAGRYSQFEIQRGLPVMQMLRYFEQNGEDWIAKEHLRRAVTFAEHNMLQAAPHFGKFDAILCRNMLMYLCEQKRTEVLDAIGSRIADDGILMLGAAETVIGQTQNFKASQEFRGFYEPMSRATLQQESVQRIFG
jgi:chemotaxis protein methyltransferase CheR